MDELAFMYNEHRMYRSSRFSLKARGLAIGQGYDAVPHFLVLLVYEERRQPVFSSILCLRPVKVERHIGFISYVIWDKACVLTVPYYLELNNHDQPPICTSFILDSKSDILDYILG